MYFLSASRFLFLQLSGGSFTPPCFPGLLGTAYEQYILFLQQKSRCACEQRWPEGLITDLPPPPPKHQHDHGALIL